MRVKKFCLLKEMTHTQQSQPTDRVIEVIFYCTQTTFANKSLNMSGVKEGSLKILSVILILIKMYTGTLPYMC